MDVYVTEGKIKFRLNVLTLFDSYNFHCPLALIIHELGQGDKGKGEST